VSDDLPSSTLNKGDIKGKSEGKGGGKSKAARTLSFLSLADWEKGNYTVLYVVK